jgi:hypothetical protein
MARFQKACRIVAHIAVGGVVLTSVGAIFAVVLWLLDKNSELSGNLGFALLVAAVFSVIGVTAGSMVTGIARVLAGIAWATVAVATLVFCSAIGALSVELSAMVFYFSMTVLTVPIGLLVIVAAPVLTNALASSVNPSLGLLLIWAVFFVLGCFQWFLVLPRVWQFAVAKCRIHVR